MGFDFAAYRMSDSKMREGLFYISMLGVLDAGVMAAGAHITKTPAHFDTSMELLTGSMAVALLVGFTETVCDTVKTARTQKAQKSQPAP